MNRFQRAYDALIEAYFEGTLAKGDCMACAVGNIVAVCMGGEVILENHSDLGLNFMYQGLERPKTDEDFDPRLKGQITPGNSFWEALFVTGRDMDGKLLQENNIPLFPALAQQLRELTGYSAEELARIEYAFETNTRIHLLNYQEHIEQDILEDQYNGLAAVVEVLCELEGITTITEHQQKFREHPALLAV